MFRTATSAARRLFVAIVMPISFGALFASRKRKTFANYRSAVPGIKSFFKFPENFSKRRIGYATVRETVACRRSSVSAAALSRRARQLPRRVTGDG
jgi:hypothetical protein